MTIGTNYTFTYADVINATIDRIIAICQNIDGWKSSVPAMYRNGHTKTYAQLPVEEEAVSSGKKRKIGRAAFTATLQGRVNDSMLVTVSSSIVRNQFNQFITSRGISGKPDEVMSVKAIMQFFNNVSSFIAARVFLVHSPFENTRGVIMYNSGDVTYQEVSLHTYTPTYYTDDTTGVTMQTYFYKLKEPYVDDESAVYTPVLVDIPNTENLDAEFNFIHDTDGADVNTSVQEFLKQLDRKENMHQALIQLVYTSCSSSSSSSSSTFIAYMDI